MRKIVLTIVGSMFISLCAVQAQNQNDTTGTASRNKQQKNETYEKSRQKSDRTRQGNDQAWQQQNDRNKYSGDYANEGMVVIDKNEMPPSLKQTLQQKKYAGWENGTIYHNTNTGEYVIAPRAYRFDKQGKEMEMGNSQAYGNREGRQGRYSSGDRNSQYRQSPSSSRDQADNTEQSDNAQSSQTQRSEDDAQAQQNGDQTSAQQPSSSYRTDRPNQSDASTQSQEGQPSQNQYRTEDMVEIQAEQVPGPLRTTLKGSQYRGWEENGTLYQDRSSNEYVLEMQNTEDASQPRVYRFDKSGQLKPGQNGTDDSDQ